MNKNSRLLSNIEIMDDELESVVGGGKALTILGYVAAGIAATVVLVGSAATIWAMANPDKANAMLGKVKGITSDIYSTVNSKTARAGASFVSCLPRTAANLIGRYMGYGDVTSTDLVSPGVGNATDAVLSAGVNVVAANVQAVRAAGHLAVEVVKSPVGQAVQKEASEVGKAVRTGLQNAGSVAGLTFEAVTHGGTIDTDSVAAGKVRNAGEKLVEGITGQKLPEPTGAPTGFSNAVCAEVMQDPKLSEHYGVTGTDEQGYPISRIPLPTNVNDLPNLLKVEPLKIPSAYPESSSQGQSWTSCAWSGDRGTVNGFPIIPDMEEVDKNKVEPLKIPSAHPESSSQGRSWTSWFSKYNPLAFDDVDMNVKYYENGQPVY